MPSWIGLHSYSRRTVTNCVDVEAKLECPLQGASLGSDYNRDPGLPTRQNPSLGLADEIQVRKGIRLIATAP